MISAWWLLLIVPVSFYFGAFTMALLAVTKRSNNYDSEKK